MNKKMFTFTIWIILIMFITLLIYATYNAVTY